MIREFSNLKLSEASIGKILQKIFNIAASSEISWLRIQVKLADATILIPEEFQKTIIDLYQKTSNSKSTLTSIELFKDMCGVGYSCPNIRHLLKNDLINHLIIEEPLKYYLELVFELETLKSVKKEKCGKCLKRVLKSLNKIKEKLEQTNLIRDYLKLPPDIKIKPLELIYERLIAFEIIPDKEPPPRLKTLSTTPLLDSYIIGPYQISIYPPSEVSNEYLYKATPLLSERDSDLTVKHFQKYIGSLNYFSKNVDDYYPPEQLIEIRKKQAESFVKTNLSSSSPKTDKILIEYLSYQTTALKPLIPYLLDDQIEEIFIDNPYSRIYLDHRRFGRCITPQLLDKNGFDKLVTYLRATTGLRLDAKNPSLKTELLTTAFHIRISVDISPLAADGFHVDIRKLRRKYFSITELIANNTLTAEAAAYLYFCMIRKKSILALGRPGDGKTTIINALDGLTPSFWRKITVEDVIESMSQTGVRHQTRFQVNPLESGNIRGGKAKEIVKLLHRSPDYLLISEIQTQEDSKALFHALSAGLSGLFTCHGNSVEDLLLRWSVHHGIPAISFHELDLLVHVKKFDLHETPTRKIVRIAEITNMPEKLFSNSMPEIQDIFTWDVHNDKLVLKTDLYETPTLQKIKHYEDLSKEQFYNELNTYRIIFELLTRKQVYSIEESTLLFSKLYSLIHKIKQTEKTVDWDEVLLWCQREIGG